MHRFETVTRRISQAMLLLSLIVLFRGTATAHDAEMPVTKLPQNVVDGAHGAWPDAKFVSAIQRSKDGKAIRYDILVQDKGAYVNVLVDADTGAVQATAAPVTAKHLPDLVHDAVVREFPDYKIAEIRRITEYKTEKVTYSLKLSKLARALLDVIVTPSGTVVTKDALDD